MPWQTIWSHVLPNALPGILTGTILAISREPFIVFSANTFAILGLRAMYFLLADMADRFHLPGYGLALIVTLVGIKMLIMDLYKVPILWMLATVVTVLVASAAASLLFPRPASAGGRTQT